MKNLPHEIQPKLKNLPDQPGVYLMKDLDGDIIYIGKASSLRKRVSSYFHSRHHDIKVSILVRNIFDLEFIVTDSEIEALILESTLIKKYKPKYNISLKDDKKYPFIAVTISEDYPRIILTRKIVDNNDRYFGPYTDVKAARKIVSMMNVAFKLKTCKKNIPINWDERPCLNYQIKRCEGVCQGKMTRQEYRYIVNNAIRFLDGDIEPVMDNMRNVMNEYSKKLEYEKAAQIRDIIFDIQKITERQKVYSPIGIDQDFIGISIQCNEAVLVLFEFRKGILLGRKISVFNDIEFSTPGEIIKSYIFNYYQTKEAPSRIITQYKSADNELMDEYLTRSASQGVTISIPKTSKEKGIINMIQKNLDVIVSGRDSYKQMQDNGKGMLELKELFSLKVLPHLIECFDVSNIQGKYAVASMVRFKDGFPDRSSYRRYRIRGYETQNDPGMIHEVVGRRCQYLINENLILPDIIVIDGGKSQLNRVIEIKRVFDLNITIIAIAKRFEEIYFEHVDSPLKLSDTSPALRVIKNIRDEAHRFALEYHKKVRGRDIKKSILDSIPNISERRKRLLLKHFRSIRNIKNSNKQELEKVPGIGREIAKEVYDFFHRKK